MAQKKRYTGETNGSIGYSEASLKKLESGMYNGRRQKYRSSQEQTQQVKELPTLEGMLSDDAGREIWKRNYGRANRVNTGRARRNYEQQIGHNASDFRDLRNRGYESTHSDFDFSDYDKAISKSHKFDLGFLGNQGIDGLSDISSNAPDLDLYKKHPELITPEVRQSVINKFGAPIEEVLPAYERYVDAQNQKYYEEHPVRAGLEDVGSALDRGINEATARLANWVAPDTKAANFLNSDKFLGKSKDVEKKRDYVRTSDKFTEGQKAGYDALYGGADFIGSSVEGGLLTGGIGIGNAEAGFGSTIQPAKWVRALQEAYTKFGLGGNEEYGRLKRRGVDEDKAQQMANYSGLLSGLVAGATAGLGGSPNPSNSLIQNVASSTGKGAGLGGSMALINELLEKGVLKDQSTFEMSKQAYMAQGLTEQQAEARAWRDLAGRTASSAAVTGAMGGLTTLTTQGIPRLVNNAIVPVEGENLNSVWATQPALEGPTFPQLTGTVEGTQALTGSQYNVPALVDNIYPIQMPGTNGVIPMPGTNGVISNLPVPQGTSAPARTVAESTGLTNPRLIQKLEGTALTEAKAQRQNNQAAIERIKNEISIIQKDKKNYYRGNLKKAVQADIKKREAEIKKLQSENKGIDQQIKGGLKPVLDMLTTDQKNAIYSTNGKHDSVFSRINFAVKFAGDTPEAKALANTAQSAIREFVKTGSSKSVKEMTNALTELDNMAKTVNAPWKSSKGNEWNYQMAFGDQAQYLEQLQPVADIYNAERAAARAARSASSNVPAEALVEVAPENVIYHSGILSRLNKADSAGKMEGTRDTGYFGTGHYFVDQAHKSSIGEGTGYGDKPYTSVDISKYDNLFKADTDAKASQLHDFSQKMMRFVNKRNDRYYTEDGEINPEALAEYLDDLYASYTKLFGDKAMSRADFEARLNQFRNDYEYDFYDRGDSAFTTFMKEHGYNGVDSRGTNSAGTERGVVIYDLDEDSILQSNVSDKAAKSGLMNTRVRNGQPLFDEETDARIQKEIDSYNKNKLIRTEYRKLYDESKLESLRKQIGETSGEISDLENRAVAYYERILSDDAFLEKEAQNQQREFEQFGLPVEDIEKTKADLRNSAKSNIGEATERLEKAKARLATLNKQLDAENEIAEAAYKQAKATVEGTSAPINNTSAVQPQNNLPALVPTTPPTPPENPNFSLVGDPYTPQEVPNVQPTPPTTPPPTQEVPNMNGGKEKTSQYYKNTMRGTETNRDMSDKEYAKRFDEEIYKRMTIPEQQSVDMGRNFIKESGGEEKAIQRLLSGDFDSEERFSGYHIDAAEMLANSIERQAQELEAIGQDASELWRTANRLHKKIQLNASEFGVGMQALQKWKKSTPQGAFDDLVSQINKGLDKKKTTGYTKKVNALADKVEDAIASSENTAEQIANVKKAFEKNRANNQYDTSKAEQQVLNLIGGDKNTKRSVSDLVEEAGRIIKKNMGVSTLTAKDERAILNLLDAASKLEPGTRPYNVLVSRAMTIVDDSLPSSIGEKAKALLYDNMLASIKTMFTRNFGGNVVGNAIDFMAAPFQVGADAVVGKFTGERTRALTGKSIVEAAKGLGHGFKDWGQDIGYSLQNKTTFNTPRSGQESLADVLNAVHKTWKTQSDNKAVKAVHNALAAYDYVIRKGMEGGDRPIYEAQYAATKAELTYIVDKYGDKGLRKGLPADKQDLDTDDLIDALAINEALEAVLQNDSKMKEAAKNIKAFFKKSSEDMLGIDIASMSHAPFVEVPANMASNFFKLTPVGWFGNINRTIGEKRKYGSINQRRFTGELGLNVLGGLMGAGLIAAAKKYISGPYSDKKEEKKLQQNNGYQEYAVQTADEKTQADLSDIPYLGPMIKFAKMERDALDEGGVKGALSALAGSTGAATVDTLYQSLNRLTGADFQYNGSGNLVGNAINNIKSSIGSMGVPSWIRQTAQYLDDYKRDLGDYGTDEYNKNLIINGIPILREKMLEPKIDTAGQPVPELGGAKGLNRFLSAYVSPWKISHPHENTSAVQEYANMIKQATEGKVNPQMKVINKSDLTKIKGYDAENYSHADLRALQEDYYKSNTELGNALINDPWFTEQSYEKQGELLNELWTANKALAQENFVRKGKTKEQIEAAGDTLYTTDNKLAGIIRDDDEKHTGLLKWLKDETDRDAMNAKYGTEMSHDNYVKYNEREEGYADQRASETDKAKALGMTVDNYEKYEKEYPGGAQGKYDDTEGAKKYGFVNANNVANTDAYNIAKQLGDGDPTVIQAYSDYKKQGIASNAYGAKAAYLDSEDRLTNQQKGMIIAGSQDGTKIGKLSKGAQEMYNLGGYEGVNYYYLLKNQADADGSGRVSKKERQAFFEADNPYLDELWQFNQDAYTYLMNNLN